MVFEFLKKKLQDAISTPARPTGGGADANYEERRREAERVYEDGRTTEAVELLEQLASDLAGLGNFTLAVAVRHQIHQWKPEMAELTTAELDGQRLATIRAQSGEFPALAPRLDGLSKVVEASSLLSALSAEEITGLIESTGLCAFPSGQAVVEEGGAGDQLYIVTRGFLDVSTKGIDGNRVSIGKLTVGDFFGEVALLTGRPRAATVTAETDAECLRITQESWTQLSEKHPTLRAQLEESIRVRAENAAEAILDDLRRRRSGEEAD